MRDVYSSNVSSIGHDQQSGELWVTWDTGKTSIYSGVPSDVASSVMNDWSVGKALTGCIKGQFEHRYG